MYKVIAAIAVLGALAVAGIAESSPSSSQYGGPDRLFGGGRFAFDFDPSPTGELIVARDISVEATRLGEARSTGTRYYGNPARTDPAPALSISCLEVEGGSAVIGATDQEGIHTVQYFEDNGPPGPALADRITPVLLVSTPEDLALMPKHFPLVCPPPVLPAQWGDVWVAVDSGDFSVVNGAS